MALATVLACMLAFIEIKKCLHFLNQTKSNLALCELLISSFEPKAHG